MPRRTDRIGETEDQKIWIPFVDLMSGTVAVLIVFFLLVILQNRQKTRSRAARVEKTFLKLMKRVEEANLSKIITVDAQKSRISLEDAVFEIGKAELSTRAKEALQKVASEELLPLINEEETLQILVEGHTDANPLARSLPSPFGGVLDNYSLSAARAKTARDLLVSAWPDQAIGRVSIAGYGPSRLRFPKDPLDGRNRRVEIRIEVDSLSAP